MQSLGFSPSVSGWKIDYHGNAEFINITTRGEIKSAVFVKNFVQALYGLFSVANPAAV